MSKSLYLETDDSGICLGASLLQMQEGMDCGCSDVPDNAALCPVAFASKHLSSVDWQCSNIEREALYKRRTYHHKMLVAMVSKDIAMLSQCVQHTHNQHLKVDVLICISIEGT